MKNPKNILSTYFSSIHANKGLIAFSFPEFNQSIGKREQSKVPADAYILTGMVLRTTLTNDNVACNCGLTPIDLNSQALAL